MALNVTDLQAALIEAAGIQSTDTAGRDDMSRIAQAIHNYMLTATVTVTVTGTAATVPGPSAVTGVGTGSLS